MRKGESLRGGSADPNLCPRPQAPRISRPPGATSPAPFQQLTLSQLPVTYLPSADAAQEIRRSSRRRQRRRLVRIRGGYGGQGEEGKGQAGQTTFEQGVYVRSRSGDSRAPARRAESLTSPTFPRRQVSVCSRAAVAGPVHEHSQQLTDLISASSSCRKSKYVLLESPQCSGKC